MVKFKEVVSPIYGVTLNSQKTYLYSWKCEIIVPFCYNSLTSTQKQEFVIFGCGWPGLKWIAT